ncbi:MAG TPA: DUF2157 domain-containing protein [Thermoanaerobaculia bacterium]|nr:DUF2157 domain-containing protein [Thermoanaerobaculia bacterium]
MNPDVAQEIPELVKSGVLPPAQASMLLRVARGELMSVHTELRALLSLGVLLVTGGVGVLVAQNLDRIGPVAIAVGLGVAAVAALAWVALVAPPFTWDEVESPHLALDAILLLGVLLAGADLAYIEVQFTPLGAQWPWHLLIVALLCGVAAFRFDSRAVFAVALSTFAAWRGVSAAQFGAVFGADATAVRWNALACGALFAALGFVLVRARRKAHFEPVAVHLGWLLIFGALGSGMIESEGLAWAGALLLTGAALAAGAFRVRRFSLFAFGVVAAYAGLSRIALDVLDYEEVFGCFWFSATSILMLVGLILAQRRLRETP